VYCSKNNISGGTIILLSCKLSAFIGMLATFSFNKLKSICYEHYIEGLSIITLNLDALCSSAVESPSSQTISKYFRW
jgi:hypothetical protein